MASRTIYLDYNATTPLNTDVRNAMLPFLGEIYGNPSSVHHVGRRARALLDAARDRLATSLRCKPSELVFTSGGTESNNLALFGAARLLKSKGRHIISTSIEHHAVLHSVQYLATKEGFELTLLPVDRHGRVDPDDLKKAIRPDTILVSVMAANNEIGTLQPVSDIGAICRSKGVLFHTDAVQWFGKEEFSSIDQFNADLVSICSHKFYGPKGSGVLYARSPLHLEPTAFGGSHENEQRAGTENLTCIIGFVEAFERFVTPPVFHPQTLRHFSALLRSALSSLPGVTLVSPSAGCLSNTVSFTVDHSDSIALLAGLDIDGICASSGSACSSGSVEPSHVVLALGWDEKQANSLVRFSIGRENTLDEIEFTASVLSHIITRAQLS